MRSNTYTLLFMSTITIVLGFLLSITATTLKDRQERNVENDIKKNILKCLNIPEERDQKLSADVIQNLFTENITGIVVDYSGNTLRELERGELAPKRKDQLPIYTYKVNATIKGYAIPISGKGLWSTIYGYLALEPDGNSVKGITFYQHGETPGLGGEIEKDWFTSNFVGKRIADTRGNLIGIEVVKGKADPGDPHQVDGISGSTLTCKGLTRFLKEDLERYDPFFNSIRGVTE